MANWIKSVFFSLIIGCVIFLGFFQFHTGLLNQMGVNTGDNYSEVYDTVNETIEITNEMGENVYEGQQEGADTYFLMGKQIFQGLRLIFSVPELVINVLNVFAAELGIPGWIMGAFYGLLVIAVVIFIFATLTKTST